MKIENSVYKKLYNKIKEIVEKDGDYDLNIDNFIKKLLTEIDFNGVDSTSKWNGIPIDILKELKEADQEYNFLKELKND